VSQKSNPKSREREREKERERERERDREKDKTMKIECEKNDTTENKLTNLSGKLTFCIAVLLMVRHKQRR